MQYRQGDILLIKVGSIPKSAKKCKPQNGRLILAEGKATGHSHSILALYGFLFMDAKNGLFAQIKNSCNLQHQEHGPIPIDPGVYEIRRQREYFPDAIRNVAD